MHASAHPAWEMGSVSPTGTTNITVSALQRKPEATVDYVSTLLYSFNILNVLEVLCTDLISLLQRNHYMCIFPSPLLYPILLFMLHISTMR